MFLALTKFRTELYESMPYRADALLDLIDALSSNSTARSAIELSLNPLFRRQHSSLPDAIDNFFQASGADKAAAERRVRQQALVRLIGPHLPKPVSRNFWLLGLDVTPVPRPFARTLADRTFIYQPNVVKGVKPVNIGHQASVVACLLEKGVSSPPWLIPLLINRVPSDLTGRVVGAQQIRDLLTDEQLPFARDLTVLVGDGAYGVTPFLGALTDLANLVVVSRVAANRVFYRQPPVAAQPGQGHPRWYGDPFNLKTPTTWGTPDEVHTDTYTSRSGQTYTLELWGWYDLLMRGRQEHPMHQHPFTLVRARLINAQGQAVFPRPLWFVIFGPRRRELSLREGWDSYDQRGDLEHFFRFGKQKLLWLDYQTPVVEHEENWWPLVQVAYVQLWLARDLTSTLPRPWERYLPAVTSQTPSPAMVQRDFGRIIRQIGTPAQSPKRRGKSPGRAKGCQPGRRKRLAVLKKATKLT
jgi:hypothetical protein